MKTHGKKFRAAAERRDIATAYQPRQAIEIVKQGAYAKFDETVEITIYGDKSFTFILKTPPAAVLLKKEAGIEKGSGVPNRTKVGSVTRAQIRKIAELKMPDLNTDSIESAMAMVAGAARSMGVEAKG